jgi:hypothetical protein
MDIAQTKEFILVVFRTSNEVRFAVILVLILI